MKKVFALIAILSMVFVAQTANAQFQKGSWSKTSVSGTDTATGTITMPFSTVASFTMTVTRTSGTQAGKVYVYGYNTVVGSRVLLDSATFSGNTTVAYANFNHVSNSGKFTQLPFYKYQFYLLNTSGAATLDVVGLVRSPK
ncbi:MAG: hypothetical protein WCG90_08230 [Chitinophagia bacterium]